MRIRKIIQAVSMLLAAAALASCNAGATPAPTIDVNAIFTFAASTMDAQLNSQGTQTAQAAPPTAQATITALPTFQVISGGTPFSINTPGGAVAPTASTGGSTLGSTAVGCDDASFQSETVPDGTQFSAGDAYTKSWSFQNTGTCTWNLGYTFAFIKGDQMGGKDIVLSKDADFTAPGHSQAFNVKMTAPATAGEYKGFWQMKNAAGTAFGSQVWVDIVVK